MANSWFQFKKFRIRQDRAAMKVTTDACLLGAWADAEAAQSILDIGTGTGLLALMVAQRSTALVDAIEIDPASVEQAKENVNASPWASRIHVMQHDVKAFFPGKKYDLIICNPPFFENQLHSPFPSKNQARHNVSLNSSELIASVMRLLDSPGKWVVLLPYSQKEELVSKVKSVPLNLTRQLFIRDQPHVDFRRVILQFQTALIAPPITETLSLKNAEGKYSAGFIRLMKDYYLHL
jgi:tRNA1Val (adenine37-N6)-methyltransferase